MSREWKINLHCFRNTFATVGKISFLVFLFVWMALNHSVLKDINILLKTYDVQEIWRMMSNIVPWLTIPTIYIVILLLDVMSLSLIRIVEHMVPLLFYSLLTLGISYLVIDRKIFEAVLLYPLCVLSVDLLISLCGRIMKKRRLKENG